MTPSSAPAMCCRRLPSPTIEIRAAPKCHGKWQRTESGRRVEVTPSTRRRRTRARCPNSLALTIADMAIYHFRAKLVKRKDGRSVVGAAAPPSTRPTCSQQAISIATRFTSRSSGIATMPRCSTPPTISVGAPTARRRSPSTLLLCCTGPSDETEFYWGLSAR